MSALIPVNSTVSVNDFMNGYFDSVSTVDNIGETDKLLLVQNGELKAASGDNLVSETTIENNFASWANSYLPVGSTATPSLISGAQSQKLANLTTATATNGTKGYMSAADKTKLDNLTTYARVGGSNTQDGLVNAIATTYENPRFFSIAPGANVGGWHDGVINTELLATTAHPGLMSAADRLGFDRFKIVSIEIPYQQNRSTLQLVQLAYNHSDMPKGRDFIATISSGSVYTAVGHWYEDMNYGYCIIQNFANAHYIRFDNGTWKYGEFDRTSGAGVAIKIGSGAQYTGTIRRYGKMRIFNFYYHVDSSVGTVDITTPIGIVSEEDMPYLEETSCITGLSNASWAVATQYPLALFIVGNSATNYNYTPGGIYLRGKPEDIAKCREFRGQLTWVVA